MRLFPERKLHPASHEEGRHNVAPPLPQHEGSHTLGGAFQVGRRRQTVLAGGRVLQAEEGGALLTTTTIPERWLPRRLARALSRGSESLREKLTPALVEVVNNALPSQLPELVVS